MNCRKIIVLCLLAGVLLGAGNTQARDELIFKRPGPDASLVGSQRYVKTGAKDTLADIGERFGLGYRALRLANPNVDPWLPGVGTSVLLPRRFLLPDAPRKGIVLNSAEMRLYYYPPDAPDKVITFPVSVGRAQWKTPVGSTTVARKVRNPSWYPPRSIKEQYEKDGRQLPDRVLPGPDNPLGEYTMYLDIRGYLIHGTNHPYGIGMPVTHGCIRLHPDDIKMLYQRVPAKTPVTLVYQRFKVGWDNGVLYLEAHPPLDDGEEEPSEDMSTMVDAVIRATSKISGYWINWERAQTIAGNPDGLPHPIGRETTHMKEITRR